MSEALEKVLEMARTGFNKSIQNGTCDNPDETQEAIDMVEDLIVNEYGED